MPAIIELRLSPADPVGSGRGSGYQPTTRHLHGLACALFEGAGADHDGADKPFSVWPLRDDGSGGWLLRAAWLHAAFPQQILAACGRVRLGPVECAVTDIAFRPVTHSELADIPPVDGIRLTFLSPAYFSQGGTGVTDPDVRLIAGSWRRRWNTSLPVGSSLEIGAELWRDIHLALHLTGSGLRTETRDTGYHRKPGQYRQQPGLTGTATLRLETGAPATVRQAFGALARFAEYCGTGAQVTHGFGATRVTLLHTSWTSRNTPSPPAIQRVATRTPPPRA